MSKLFEDDKENRDPNTACGVVRRNSVRRKATTESPKPVLIEKKKTGMEQGLVVCVTNDWTGSVIGILYVCECGIFYFLCEISLSISFYSCSWLQIASLSILSLKSYSFYQFFFKRRPLP